MGIRRIWVNTSLLRREAFSMRYEHPCIVLTLFGLHPLFELVIESILQGLTDPDSGHPMCSGPG